MPDDESRQRIIGNRSNASSSVMEMQRSSIPLRRRRTHLAKNPIAATFRKFKPNKDNHHSIEELKRMHKEQKSSMELNRVKVHPT